MSRRKFGDHYYDLDSTHNLNSDALDRKRFLTPTHFVRITKGKMKFMKKNGKTKTKQSYTIWKAEKKR